MSETPESAQRANLLPRACEGCRVRKIRCNKSNPCSNCAQSGITCQPTNKSFGPKAQSTGSHYYEKHFSLLNERLLRIEKLLREPGLRGAVSDHSPHECVLEDINGSLPSAAEPLFRGSSSFNSQTVQATLSADIAVGQDLNSVQDSDIHAALSSLRALLHGEPLYHGELQFSTSHLETSREGELPPASFTLTLLRKIKEKPSLASLEFASRDDGQFEGLCQRAYFPSVPLSTCAFTLLNGWLYYTIQEYRVLADPDLADFNCKAYQDMCETNFVSALRKYDYMSVPSLENLQCLLLGAAKAHESSRPALCWNLVCTASRMCQNLGYHRRSTLQEDSLAESKRHAFWMTYMMEKNLALTFGRASSFPDYDIDAELFTPSPDLGVRPWDILAIFFIRFATLQGQIYERLYSAQAVSAPPAERMHAVEDLASKLSAWRIELNSIDGQLAHYRDEFRSSIMSADVIYYSVLTILYREKFSDGTTMEISSRCFEAARLSLKCHLQACGGPRSRDISRWTAYIDWVLLYIPFTPFLVVFIHVLATRNEGDLKLLQEVLEILDGARVLSEAAGRLHRVCAALVRIAQAFLSSMPMSFGSYDYDTREFTLPTATEPFTTSINQYTGDCDFEGGLEFTATDISGMSSILGDWFGDDNSFRIFDQNA